MRYCFLTYGPWEGNAGQIRPRGLGMALLDRGIEVVYVVDDFPYNRTSLGIDDRAEVRYVPHPRGARQIPNRRRVLRDVKPDVLHLINPHAKALAAIAGRHEVTVLAEWDEPPVLRPFGPLRLTLERFLDSWLRRRANHVVACTREVQRSFAARHGMEVAYVPHATYLPPFADSTSPFEEPTAVYLGTFAAQWDHDLLFHALEILARRGLGPRVEFIGYGEEMVKWQRYCAAHGLANAVFAGFLAGEELQRHLRHAHVSLFPIRDTALNRSRCPSKLFAYAQAGRPVIASRVGEVPEILGEDVTYVEPTPEAFAEALEVAMQQRPRPAIDYRAERHTYADRAQRLLAML